MGLRFRVPPNLVTITVDGRTIDAVAEVSKQGFTYVFDRVTGEPVWPIEERPVDTTTDVPGERPYPTQPFPTKPPAFTKQGVWLDDANDLTPEIHALAWEEMSQFRLGPLFTPPSLRGTLQRPTVSGGANWGGAAFDPETGLLYVRTREGVSTNQICTNEGADPDVDVAYSNNCPHGAVAGIFRDRPGGTEVTQSRLGAIPIIKPPYAYLVAIDLSEGEIAWRVPFGEGAGSSAAIRCCRASSCPSASARPAATVRWSQKGASLHRGRGPVSVCVRQGDRRRGLAGTDDLPHQREPHDVPGAVGPPVRGHRNRRRA